MGDNYYAILPFHSAIEFHVPPMTRDTLKSAPLLEVEDLRTYLGHGDTVVRAVDGLNFSIHRGEAFVLLGESGCGKSMTALSLMRLLPPGGRIIAGRVMLD